MAFVLRITEHRTCTAIDHAPWGRRNCRVDPDVAHVDVRIYRASASHGGTPVANFSRTRQLVLLDFDPTVSGVASQPLWLRWTGEDDRRVSHAPDYFVRRADGSGLVVDCRPVDRRPARDVAKFEATACAQIGWEYQLLGAAEPVAAANARWLAGY